MMPLHCLSAMRLGPGQVRPFSRVTIEVRGRVFITVPGRQQMRHMSIPAPIAQRAVVVVPSPRLTGSPGPQCVAIWRPRQ